MLFSSIPFLAFFAIVYILVFVASKYKNSRSLQMWIILIASLFFYSYWNPPFLILLGLSIIVNYLLSIVIIKNHEQGGTNNIPFYFGLLFNLGLIAYYKYAYFLVDSINSMFSTNIGIRDDIFLPLGISFFTFQQIAFLIDCKKGLSKKYNFKEYTLFISFFPQLIAGPIVHHKEMMPQFEDKSKKLITYENFAVGFVLLAIGLFKKLVIADNAAMICDPFFAKSLGQTPLYMIDSWVGVLAYTFQIYFDFSGYCDMALGVARMLGIVLPINFFSPYKSRNISDFWRLWHITLSRFLRDYVYIPLGGNRKGKPRRYMNLMATMLVGGLWHGASWTFVVWGGLHGLYLVINHFWSYIKKGIGFLHNESKALNFLGTFSSISITFLAVVFAWVFFRATTFDSAFKICSAMFGENGLGTLKSTLTFFSGGQFKGILGLFNVADNVHHNHYAQLESIVLLFGISLIVFLLPNSVQIAEKFNPVIDPSKVVAAFSEQFKIIRIAFKPSLSWAVFIAVIFVFSVLNMTRLSPFLYFQF
ncbi:MAG: MBOAT family protein [Bacteroidia bacterium]|nr:MBOAT family protein [Bacteroidia bacterium]